MATTTNTITVPSPSLFISGKTYSWVVVHLIGLESIETVVDNLTETTIDITDDSDLLPAGIESLSDCNLICPILVVESCCDVTFYDVLDTAFLTDLPGAGIPALAPLGRNIIRSGANPRFPNEVWEYDSQGGDPQDIENWYRIEILPGSGDFGDNWGSQVVVTDPTLTGNGTATTPLSAVLQVADGTTILGTGVALDPFVVANSTDLSATQAHDPALLGDGAGENVAIAVAGAVIGDFVLVSYGLSTSGILFTGAVTAAGTVTVRIQNETGGAIDLAASNINIKVIKL